MYGILHAIAQAVSCRCLTADAFAPAWPVYVGFVVDKMAIGTVLFRILQYFPVAIIPPVFHIHSCII
jgi:hypothetical protein